MSDHVEVKAHVFFEDKKITFVMEGDVDDPEHVLRAFLEMMRHQWRENGVDFVKACRMQLDEMTEQEKELN